MYDIKLTNRSKSNSVAFVKLELTKAVGMFSFGERIKSLKKVGAGINFGLALKPLGEYKTGFKICGKVKRIYVRNVVLYIAIKT